MKAIIRKFACLMLGCCGWLTGHANSVSVSGPEYTCPDSELIYYYHDDWSAVWVTFHITNGQIYNAIIEQWQDTWQFNRSSYTWLNNSYPFRIKWNDSPLGTIGNVNVKICSTEDCGTNIQGDMDVTFNADPGAPIITGRDYILNCLSEQKNYTASSPPNWNLIDWDFTSEIEQVGGGVNPNPVTVQAVNTTYSGPQTLTGVFNFTTGGNTCGTKNVSKNIRIGTPSPIGQTIDGVPSGGGQLCPGWHTAGVSYTGPVSSSSWDFDPQVPNTPSALQCDFYVDSNGPSSFRILAIGTNECGAGDGELWFVSKRTFGCGAFAVAAYPNPANDKLTIHTTEVNMTDGSESNITAKEVFLIDKFDSKVISEFPSESTVNLDITKIPRGEYFLQVRFDNEIIKRHIFIK